MARSIAARVKPELVRWARESIGMDLDAAASKLSVPIERLERWESGEETLTIAQMRKVATTFKRPLSVFFLPQPPKDFQAMRDFRRLPGIPDAPSTALLQEFRSVASRRRIALELAEAVGVRPQAFNESASLKESPEDAAARLRQKLRVSIEEQRDWKTDYDAWNGWRAAAEDLDILVFQMSGIDVQESRGFSAYFDSFPVVAANTKDPPVARCFTLMHELGHLVLRGGAVCDSSVMGDVRSNPIEIWCNAFAAELLVPASDFRAAVKSYPYRDAWPREALVQLAHRYRVSQEVIYRRLLTIQRASERAYQAWKAAYRPPKTPKKQSGGPEFAVRVVSNAGRAFVQLALSAYGEGRITASTLSGHLGANLKHLPRIQEIILSGRSDG